MPLSGLLATSEYSPEARYRRGDRRAPDRAVRSEADLAPPPPSDPATPIDGAYFASRFKADLSQIATLDGAPAPGAQEVDPTLADFFGNLSVLLVAVRSGDIVRAQAAADALELDALVDHSAPKRPGASAPLLDDLVALLGAAHAQDEEAAKFAARGLANDVQTALTPVPFAPRDAYAEDDSEDSEEGAGAFDALNPYLAGEPGAV